MFRMKKEFKALGTDISIQVVSDDEKSLSFSPSELEKIEMFYRHQEKIFSRFDKASELFRLNASLGGFQPASHDIIKIAEKALAYHQKSNGFYDPRIISVLENIGYQKDFKNNDFSSLTNNQQYNFSSSLESDLKIQENQIFLGQRMDFSGIVKGYISDQVVRILKEKGAENILVDSGGDIKVAGHDFWGENWKVSIEGVPEEKMLFELKKDYPGIATSGISRRKWSAGEKQFHHLINPHDPYNFEFELKTVTVIAKSTEEADVWAKVLFLLGKDRGLAISQEKNLKSLFIDCRGNVYLSSAIKENIINL